MSPHGSTGAGTLHRRRATDLANHGKHCVTHIAQCDASPDVVTVSYSSGHVVQFDVGSLQETYRVKTHPASVTALCQLHAGGAVIASGSSAGHIFVTDTRAGGVVAKFEVPGISAHDPVAALASLRNDTKIAAACGTAVHIFDVVSSLQPRLNRKRKPIVPGPEGALLFHSDQVTCLAVPQPTGSVLLSGAEDTLVNMCDIARNYTDEDDAEGALLGTIATDNTLYSVLPLGREGLLTCSGTQNLTAWRFREAEAERIVAFGCLRTHGRLLDDASDGGGYMVGWGRQGALGVEVLAASAKGKYCVFEATSTELALKAEGALPAKPAPAEVAQDTATEMDGEMDESVAVHHRAKCAVRVPSTGAWLVGDDDGRLSVWSAGQGASTGQPY